MGALGFRYTRADGRPVRSPADLKRIRALAIPPAWKDEAQGRRGRGTAHPALRARGSYFLRGVNAASDGRQTVRVVRATKLCVPNALLTVTTVLFALSSPTSFLSFSEDPSS